MPSWLFRGRLSNTSVRFRSWDANAWSCGKDPTSANPSTRSCCQAAGLILLAQTVEEGIPAAGDPTAEVAGGDVAPGAFGTLPVTVRRNAYGRQLGSFHAEAPFSGVEGDVPMTFIRAPYIAEVHEGATPLATVDERIVAVRAENQIGVAFHPELNDDLRIHELFVSLIG